MNEILTSYLQNCNAVGAARVLLLEAAVSAGIAYSIPVPIGTAGEDTSYYATLVMAHALDVISKVNERVVINTDRTLSNAKKLWIGRYEAVNSSNIPQTLFNYYDEVKKGDPVVAAGYNYWAKEFTIAVKAVAEQSTQ